MDETDDYTPQSDGYKRTLDGLDEKDLQRSGIHVKETRNGLFDPIMTSSDDLEDMAYEVADIIDKTGRVPLNFAELAHAQGLDGFVPDCSLDKGLDLYLDTDTSSKQSGKLQPEQLPEVVNTKIHCFECPLKRECLALSFTGVQITRTSRSEVVIPGTNVEDKVPLVMNDYMISGGLTPQERRIVFERVCDILSEADRNRINAQRTRTNTK